MIFHLVGCGMGVAGLVGRDGISRPRLGAGGGESGDLPLLHLQGRDHLRIVESACPLVELDRHARPQQAQRVVDASSPFGSNSAVAT
ncbi:hypothetical protein [Streptomyces sp. NPDC046332]|uniref:hypothetical protein n=1 Tax=unclassified Streptomyces TaxID=2593676 RepID=UPI00340A6D3D